MTYKVGNVLINLNFSYGMRVLEISDSDADCSCIKLDGNQIIFEFDESMKRLIHTYSNITLDNYFRKVN